MGSGVENVLRKLAHERVFFLSNLQEQIPTPPEKACQRHTTDSLHRLVQTLGPLTSRPVPETRRDTAQEIAKPTDTGLPRSRRQVPGEPLPLFPE